MTLREINYEVELLNNELEKLLRDKAMLEVITDPKSTDYSKVVVDGGIHGNILDIYVEKTELERYKDLDKKISFIQEKIKSDMDWIEKELIILKKYGKTENLIVYYKEISPQKYTWYEISAKVHYSVGQCKRIYKNYKEKRNI